MDDAASETNGQRARRQDVRDGIRTGKLPSRRPDRVWGGRGDGAECSVCNTTVRHDELEFELEFIWNGDVANHHVHIGCFTAWEHERDNLPLAEDDLQQSA